VSPEYGYFTCNTRLYRTERKREEHGDNRERITRKEEEERKLTVGE